MDLLGKCLEPSLVRVKGTCYPLGGDIEADNRMWFTVSRASGRMFGLDVCLTADCSTVGNLAMDSRAAFSYSSSALAAVTLSLRSKWIRRHSSWI